MSELQDNLTKVIRDYFNEILKVNVAGTSLFQHMEREMLAKLRAKASNYVCEKCKCCTILRNALTPSNDHEITGNSEQNDDMETPSMVVSTPNGKTPRQGATKRRWPSSLPTTQKTRQLADRSCKKNISYSAKIPHIRRPDWLNSLEHTGRARKKIVAPKRSNCSLEVPAPKGRKTKPVKKPQKKGFSETVFCYKKFKGGRIDKSVSVKHKGKQYQIKQKKLSKALLVKLARTAGTGETVSSHQPKM